MLSVAEVYEMEPGTKDEAVWINPGLTGVLTVIKRARSKKGQPMFICTLQDLTGSAEISMTLFDQCEFNEGDVVEVFGKGLRRSEFDGLQQISLGRETEVHKVGTSAHGNRETPPPASTPAGASHPPTGQPDNRSADHGIFGGTVGMAMKEAIKIHIDLCGQDVDPVVAALCSNEFWAAVHETASDIIRISLALEKGKLAPSVRERNRSPEKKAAEEKAALEKAEADRKEQERIAAEKAAAEKKNAASSKSADGEDGLPY